MVSKQFVFQTGTRNGQNSASVLSFQPIGNYRYHADMPFAKWKGSSSGKYRMSGTLVDGGRIMNYSGAIELLSRSKVKFRWRIEGSNFSLDYRCLPIKLPRDFDNRFP